VVGGREKAVVWRGELVVVVMVEVGNDLGAAVKSEWSAKTCSGFV
jgi:hypothetical protein